MNHIKYFFIKDSRLHMIKHVFCASGMTFCVIPAVGVLYINIVWVGI